MYILLAGVPPFLGDTSDEIVQKVVNNEISFPKKHFKTVSDKALDLLKKLLTYDPKERITAEAALTDKWFMKLKATKTMDNEHLLKCLQNLKKFQVESVMKKAALSYMAARVLSKKREKKLRNVFESLDQGHRGILSFEDLQEGYISLSNGDRCLANEESKKVIENIDVNKNGSIDYNGNSHLFYRIFNGEFD